MERKTDRLYPSAPLENNDLEQRLEKKLMLTVLVIISTALNEWYFTSKT